ncbi:mitochondrial sodium/calcium exchanger protein-like [Argiope bruennichi]|uniref:mitochondrial sodium/calcium exchanger protein-like n=1 Tax=Argiope bruennichi TaxID=94029 RepID=UPI002494177F|nr:mitochondrial sodium/calcium exchanger protein-like [Argiope bruennichi]XP_055933968.1 mitochondrial sodium/calcium exchanger protein-like [Argiope bruennichi]XP_055933969.1 mitochondrial sodium/calcium exchanger protein-like [Argiope bruennichi]XP_055933970.1 mitochondrial sodium/calcium exchanger protein-like [Argiope bruennichi]XP_055933971.1 mitochondrial sodium/calcium exchanger protein-like [Argiope bruennichi]
MTLDYAFKYKDVNNSFPFDLDAECTEIHDLNASMQCLFATTVEDCVEIIEYLDYNYYIFCTLTVNRITLATTSLIIWLAMLFIALGVTSNYFLCPALFTISNHLGLSQNVAGVTLLAFGNGSPDIFSSAAGLQKASAELAIASLVGAGMFVTSVVAGSVFFTQNFTLMIRPFLRDIGFYIIAISWTFALFSTGTSYLYHGIGFVALYFMYIIVVLGSRFIYLNRQKQKEKVKDQEKDNEKKEPEDKKKENKEENPEKPSANSDGIVDKIMYDNDPEATAVVLKAFYFGGFEWVDGGRRLSKAHIRLDERRRSRQNSIFSIDGNLASNVNEKNGSCQSIQTKGMSSTEKLTPALLDDRGEFYEFLVKVCPVNTEKWQTLKWYKRLIVICKSPAILIMRLTVPVLDTSAEDLNWNRFLICTQCITGPVFISLVSEYAFYMIGDVFPVFILLLAASVCCSAMVYFTSERDTPPTYHWLFAYLGFAVAVTWIYCLANEIVALLQVFGVIFNLSDAILGLTILAWGNSLSDFLSNIAVARKEFPRMAISACFGGPLLALLLGLGIPCIIEIIKGHAPAPFPLMFSSQFIFLFCAITIGLLTTAFLMIAWKFHTRRAYGIFLIILYVAFVTLSILAELKILDLPV